MGESKGIDRAMTTRLVLVCHAATAATRVAAFPADEPLDEHGLAAAVAAGGGAAGSGAAVDSADRGDGAGAGPFQRVAAAYSSPALRCTQTAAALGLRPVVDDGLRDGDVGRWAGRTLSEVGADEPEAVAAWLTDPAAAPHGGESVADLLARARNWLRRLPPVAGTVVAVTHPGVVRAVIIEAIGATPASFWRIDVAPLDQTVLKGRDGRWTLRATGRPVV